MFLQTSQHVTQERSQESVSLSVRHVRFAYLRSPRESMCQAAKQEAFTINTLNHVHEAYFQERVTEVNCHTVHILGCQNSQEADRTFQTFKILICAMM